jgi:hypothetical protein
MAAPANSKGEPQSYGVLPAKPIMPGLNEAAGQTSQPKFSQQ